VLSFLPQWIFGRLRIYLEGKRIRFLFNRYLVGLRWWNEINEDGEEVTIYESDHEGKYII